MPSTIGRASACSKTAAVDLITIVYAARDTVTGVLYGVYWIDYWRCLSPYSDIKPSLIRRFEKAFPLQFKTPHPTFNDSRRRVSDLPPYNPFGSSRERLLLPR